MRESAKGTKELLTAYVRKDIVQQVRQAADVNNRTLSAETEELLKKGLTIVNK